jgi:hypothetical protein
MSGQIDIAGRRDAPRHFQRDTARRPLSGSRAFIADNGVAHDSQSSGRLGRKLSNASIVAVPASAIFWALIIVAVKSF